MTQFNPLVWFLHLPPEAIIIFAVGAGLLATGILSFFAMKNLPGPDTETGESGLPELGEQENFWKKKKKEMGGWT